MNSKRELKTEKITIRCTEAEKRKIEEAAQELDMKAGPYALDKVLKGTACNHFAKKKIAKALVLTSNQLDAIYELVSNTAGNHIEKEELLTLLNTAREEIAITWKY